jgi:hypothetical protein
MKIDILYCQHFFQRIQQAYLLQGHNYFDIDLTTKLKKTNHMPKKSLMSKIGKG